MPEINITQNSETEFQVDIIESESQTSHIVTINPEYRTELGWGESESAELLKKSFEFLLERESKELILSEFNLEVISRYFPEYKSIISK